MAESNKRRFNDEEDQESDDYYSDDDVSFNRANKKSRVIPDDDDDQGSQDSDSSQQGKPYKIRKINETVSRRFGIEESTFKASFDSENYQNKRLLDMTEDLRDMFSDMLDEASSNYNDDDMARLSIFHRNLEQPITVHLRSKNNVTPDTVLDR